MVITPHYTVAEDGTTQTFKITSSIVDLKAHVGHDVEVIGQKANADTSSGSSDNSVVVTGVNMISEHCATVSAATANASAVADPTPAATDSAPMMASTSAPGGTDRLPDTATSLPLLGLLGLGLLATGLLSRRSPDKLRRIN